MPFNDLKTNDVDKEKNNTHKQRTFPNDECLFRGSKVHETDINGCEKLAFVAHARIQRKAIHSSVLYILENQIICALPLT